MIWSVSFSWVYLNLLVIPCFFYLLTLDYLNLPRGVLWVATSSLFFVIEFWRGKLTPFSKVDRLTALMLMFLVWSALSSTWAWQPELTWQRWSFLLLAFMTFVWVRSFNDTQKSVLLWTVAIQGGLFAVLGFLQWYEIEPFSLILQTEKPGITMGHRNVAAEYMLICLGAALSCIGKIKGWKKSFPMLLTVLCLGVIYISRCRGVLLGIILATLVALVYLIFKIKSKALRLGMVLVFVSLAVATIFVVQAKLPGVKASFSEGKIESLRMRLAHYSNTLVLIGENLPTGVGLGNFAIQYSQYLNSWVPDKHYSDRLILRNTHSDPLECLAELGPVGLLLALMILWLIMVKAKKNNWMQFALWWAILAQLFNACVNFPFQVIQTQMIVAILLGLFIEKDAFQPAWNLAIPKRRFIKVLVSCCLAFHLFHQWQRLQASYEAKMGMSYMLANRNKEAEPFLRKSIELEPRQVDHIMLLAYCLRSLGRMTESSSLAENVLGIFPSYLPAFNLIGLNALKINDLNRAVRAFELSYHNQKYQETTKEKLQLAYEMLGTEFRKRGFIKEALDLEHRLRVVRPDNLDSLRRECLDLINLKLYPQALNLIELIKIKADDEKLAYLEAKVHVATEDWIRAIETLDRGIKIAPQDLKLLKMKSEIQERFINSKPNG